MKFLTIKLLLFSTLIYCQNNTLDYFRINNCKKKCKIFSKELIDKTNNNNSTPSFFLGKPKYLKMFSIKEEDRKKIYPFNMYDTIYIAKPILIKDIKENRNYLDKKYHSSLKKLSYNEKIKFSVILFNYHKIYNLYSIAERNKIGCDCLQQEYPQIIFLFMKNGKFEKYIAFPDDGWNRHNFTNEEYQNFDWSEEKERIILETFK
jgi:hypothetical protein